MNVPPAMVDVILPPPVTTLQEAALVVTALPATNRVTVLRRVLISMNVRLAMVDAHKTPPLRVTTSEDRHHVACVRVASPVTVERVWISMNVLAITVAVVVRVPTLSVHTSVVLARPRGGADGRSSVNASMNVPPTMVGVTREPNVMRPAKRLSIG